MYTYLYSHILYVYTRTLSLSLSPPSTPTLTHNTHTRPTFTPTPIPTRPHVYNIYTHFQEQGGAITQGLIEVSTHVPHSHPHLYLHLHTRLHAYDIYTPARARRGNQSRAHRGIEASRRHDHYPLFAATAAPHMMGTSATPRRFYSLTCAGCVCVCVWRGGECVNVCL